MINRFAIFLVKIVTCNVCEKTPKIGRFTLLFCRVQQRNVTIACRHAVLLKFFENFADILRGALGGSEYRNTAKI